MRTDTTKKHEGISFLLIDMKAPGVEVRPILLINGTSPFCETFFTDVKVPKDQLFGPLNGGWTIAKRLLQFERDNDRGAALGGGNIGQAVADADDPRGREGLRGRRRGRPARRRATCGGGSPTT